MLPHSLSPGETRTVVLDELVDADGALADEWLALALGSLADSRDLDVTTTAEWSEALCHSHLHGAAGRVALARAGGELSGLFPYYRSVERVRGIRCRKLNALSQLYSGRNRLLAQDPAQFAEQLFEALLAGEATWDWLCLTLVDGSESHRALAAAAARRGFPLETVAVSDSPYIDLPGSWDTYFDSLSKKFRWLLRNSRKKLSEEGELGYRLYASPEEVAPFLDAMYDIEKGSWKETSGTSITANEMQRAFYERFSPAAAARGWLRGHVLSLNQEPIAYIYGIRLGPVFHDLKESYKLAMRDHSPGHVLKTFALPDLIAEGVTRYDFCGKCDDFKMKWTALTYRRRDLTVHRRTPRARLLNVLGQVRAWLRRWGPAGTSAAAGPVAEAASSEASKLST